MSAAPKHRLRRSCAFCRARKIKCSNQAICEACRRQGADCIYDFEPTKPKARNGGGASSNNGNQDAEITTPSTPSRPRLSISTSSASVSPLTGTSTHSFGDRSHGQGVRRCEESESIASALEQTFFDNFAPQSDSSRGQGRHASFSNESSAAMARKYSTQSQHQQMGYAQQQRRQGQSNGKMTYTGILSLLVQDLVGLVTDQFGSLGCHHVETGQARFFLSSLANDDTQTMFDKYEAPEADPATASSPISTNPVTELGQRRQTQLIDVWYSTHPLSFLVSKTLLLRELRDGTHDEVLLATILGEASLYTGNESRGQDLFCWAAAQLRDRPFRGSHLTQNGVGSSLNSASADSPPPPTGASTRIFNGISSAQALMLLGWNALTTSHMRRATCYIRLAGQIVTQLKDQISNHADPKASARVNGIDVFDVEKEVIDHLYWTTYAICLWAFVQTGNQQFAPPLPATQPSIFVPVTEATSSLIQLDIVSDNFNTLHTQKAAIRETWPLAHVASVVAYIGTFYPPDSDVALWQSGPPVAQQRLHNGQPPSMDVGVVCHEITRVLTESINHFNNSSQGSTAGGELAASRALVLAAYHTLAIHFLFPAQKEQTFSHDIIDRFCTSTQEILHSFSTICEQAQLSAVGAPGFRALLPGLFTVAFDTCSRAFSFIHFRGHTSGLLTRGNAGILEALAGRLYTTSKDDMLSQGNALRMARKQLKAFVSSLDHHQQQPSPSVHSIGSPVVGSNVQSAMSMKTEPMLINDHTMINLNPSSFMQQSSSSLTLHHSSSLRRTGSSSSSASLSDSDHLSTASTAANEATLNFMSPHPDNFIDTQSLTSHPRSAPSKLSSPIISLPKPHPTQITTTALGGPLLSPSDIFKPNWHPSSPDEMFQATGTMNSMDSHLQQHEEQQQADMQNAWFPQVTTTTMMEIDMANSMNGGLQQWEWPDMNTDAMVASGGSWEMEQMAS